jgi:PleD family two-component response regulator
MKSRAKKILIIDDSNTNIVLLEAILGNHGYEIKKCLSVKEALPIIETSLPDLILLDLLMPKVSGYEFLENLRKNKRTKNIPVIIISAVTENESKTRTKKFGIVDYIEKPVNIKELVERVGKTLSRK